MPKINNLNEQKLHPEFENFLDLVQLRKPMWTFRSARSNSEYCNRVLVFQDAIPLGGLEFRKDGGRYNPNLGHSPSAYCVLSDNISKQRGERGVLLTSDIAKAMQNAIKHLSMPNAEKMAMAVYKNVRSLVGNLEYKVKTELNECVQYSTREMMRFLAEWFLDGKDTERKLPSFVRIKEESLRNAYEERLALEHVKESFTASKGYAISKLEDDSVLVVSLFTSEPVMHRYRTFEEIPEDIASKYAVLKISEDYQCYRDIGARLENNNYYVIA